MSADMSDMEYDADDMTEDIQDDSFDLDEDIWDDNADLAEDDRMDLSANDSEWDLEEPDLEELRDPTIGEADLAVVREMEESGEFDEVLPSDLGSVRTGGSNSRTAEIHIDMPLNSSASYSAEEFLEQTQMQEDGLNMLTVEELLKIMKLIWKMEEIRQEAVRRQTFAIDWKLPWLRIKWRRDTAWKKRNLQQKKNCGAVRRCITPIRLQAATHRRSMHSRLVQPTALLALSGGMAERMNYIVR